MHSKYRLQGKAGEGAFSEVLKAQSIKTGKMTAIKCMKHIYKSVEEVNSLREIEALRRLSPHPNIVKLHEVLFDQKTGRLALVFELMECNIYELMKGRTRYLQENVVKGYIYQLMKVVDHMHRHGIFHRDIKPENLLINDRVLKLADFGSCRGIYSKQPYTEYISTRWYRAPECLLTDGYYGYKMDLWGVGCVMFEMLALYPLFPGKNEADQLELIHRLQGTPNAALLGKFREHASRHVSFNFTPHTAAPGGLAKQLPHVSAEAIDLMNKLITYDPDVRITAKESLAHPWFADIRAAEKQLKDAAKAKKEKDSELGSGATGPVFGAPGTSSLAGKEPTTPPAGASHNQTVNVQSPLPLPIARAVNAFTFSSANPVNSSSVPEEVIPEDIVVSKENSAPGLKSSSKSVVDTLKTQSSSNSLISIGSSITNHTNRKVSDSPSPSRGIIPSGKKVDNSIVVKGSRSISNPSSKRIDSRGTSTTPQKQKVMRTSSSNSGESSNLDGSFTVVSPSLPKKAAGIANRQRHNQSLSGTQSTFNSTATSVSSVGKHPGPISKVNTIPSHPSSHSPPPGLKGVSVASSSLISHIPNSVSHNTGGHSVGDHPTSDFTTTADSNFLESTTTDSHFDGESPLVTPVSSPSMQQSTIRAAGPVSVDVTASSKAGEPLGIAGARTEPSHAPPPAPAPVPAPAPAPSMPSLNFSSNQPLHGWSVLGAHGGLVHAPSVAPEVKKNKQPTHSERVAQVAASAAAARTGISLFGISVNQHDQQSALGGGVGSSGYNVNNNSRVKMQNGLFSPGQTKGNVCNSTNSNSSLPAGINYNLNMAGAQNSTFFDMDPAANSIGMLRHPFSNRNASNANSAANHQFPNNPAAFSTMNSMNLNGPVGGYNNQSSLQPKPSARTPYSTYTMNMGRKPGTTLMNASSLQNSYQRQHNPYQSYQLAPGSASSMNYNSNSAAGYNSLSMQSSSSCNSSNPYAEKKPFPAYNAGSGVSAARGRHAGSHNPHVHSQSHQGNPYLRLPMASQLGPSSIVVAPGTRLNASGTLSSFNSTGEDLDTTFRSARSETEDPQHHIYTMKANKPGGNASGSHNPYGGMKGNKGQKSKFSTSLPPAVGSHSYSSGIDHNSDHYGASHMSNSVGPNYSTGANMNMARHSVNGGIPIGNSRSLSPMKNFDAPTVGYHIATSSMSSHLNMGPFHYNSGYPGATNTGKKPHPVSQSPSKVSSIRKFR